MPEFTITPEVLANLAEHCAQEVKYFKEEGEAALAADFEALADHFDEAARSGVREITLRIIG